MEKRILFSACVLAACLGACTNDDFSTEKAQGIVESNGTETVIGADLVAHGMTIHINGNEAATRVTDEGAWEVGENADQVGMGWFNYKDGSDNIAAVQDESVWWPKVTAAWNEGSNGEFTWNASGWGSGFGGDNKLWANHIFTAVGTNGLEGWETTTDVYQGAYFAYFPYEKLGQVKAKELKVNSEPQKEEFMQDWMNNGLRLSAQDFITGADVDESNTLQQNFLMRPVVNVLRMEMAPETKIKDAPEGDGAYLKGMNITQVQLSADGINNEVFVKPGTTLEIKGIPSVRKEDNKIDGIIDEAATYNALFAAAENRSFLSNPTYEATLTTTVENKDYTLAANHDVRAFAFPIPNGVTYTDAQYPYAIVRVGRVNEDGTLKYELGQFNINVTNNSKFINKLKNSLDASKATEAASLTNLLRSGENGKTWEPLAFTTAKDAAVQLQLGDFAAKTDDIQTVDQWNDLVSVYDALNALQGEENVEDPTFVWNPKDDKEAFNGEIKTPKKGTITLQTAAGKKMTITGKTTWPENLVTVKTATANIEVSANAELTVGETDESVEVGKKVVEIEANIDNNGIIYAGKNASIGTQEPDGLEGLDNTLNADGKNRVIVTYGAYVYPEDGAKGVIAYEVQGEAGVVSKDEVSKIEVLVGNKDKNTEWANINTLIVPEGIILDLNAEGNSGSESDRYEGTDSYSYAMPDLSDVDIELEGGTVRTQDDAKLTHVKNVINVIGDGEIWDIEPLADITVKGGTLAINTNTTLHTYGKPVELIYGAEVTVNGKGCVLDVNTDLYATKVINKAYGRIEIADSKRIYIPSIDSYESEDGSELVGKFVYTDSKEADAVENMMVSLKSTNAELSSETAFLSAMNAYVKSQVEADSFNESNTTSAGYEAFYNVFNKWLVSVNRSALTPGEDEITSDHLSLFTKLTGYSFTWE